MTTSRGRFRAAVLGALALSACHSPPCADFEDLTSDTVFQVGDTITSHGVALEVASFLASGSAEAVDGNAIVEPLQGATPSTGVELRGTSLVIPVDGIDHVRMHFVRTSGLKSIVLNGFVIGWIGTGGSGSEIDPGGEVFVNAVEEAGSSGEPDVLRGTLIVAGPMKSLAVGGEHLLLEDVCIREDDCRPEPVDNGAARFAALQDVEVEDEQRYFTLLRLGKRPFHTLALILPKVSVPAGATLTVTASVQEFDHFQNPLVSAQRSVSGPLSAVPLALPLEFTFPQNNAFATSNTTYSLLVHVQTTDGSATLQTVAPVSFPACEETGRFAFFGAQRAPGSTFDFTSADAFRVQLFGKCQ